MAAKKADTPPQFTASLRLEVIVSVPISGNTFEEALANAQKGSLVPQLFTSNVELSDVAHVEIAGVSNDRAWR